MTLRTERRIGWGAFALCIVVSALATPFVCAARPLQDDIVGLTLLWCPLAAFALATIGILKSVGAESPAPDQERLGNTPGLFLLLLFGMVSYTAFPALALHREDLARPWTLLICAILFALGFVLPEPSEIPYQENPVFRWALDHWRWGYFATCSAAVTTAAISTDPTKALFVLNGLGIVLPATWIPTSKTPK